MTKSVTVLRPDEPARFNPEQLERLCAEIGELRAEAEVARALERIGQLLAEIAGRDAPASRARLERHLEALVEASDMIGMATLARVARDVRRCLGSGDVVGLSATLARLQRVGDRSIHAVWDLEDLSG